MKTKTLNLLATSSVFGAIYFGSGIIKDGNYLVGLPLTLIGGIMLVITNCKVGE